MNKCRVRRPYNSL